MDSYDVVVAGGGPAGLAAAAETARRGASTLVLERSRAIGVPVRTSGGAFIPLMRELGIPQELWHPIDRIDFFGATREASYRYPEPYGCVLEVTGLYRWLADRAAEAGADIRTATGVAAPLLEGARVTGVELRDGTRIAARLVIDATGNWSRLGSGLSLVPKTRHASGLEVVIPIPESLRSLAAFTVDRPAIYGWLFPERSGAARLGVGLLRPDTDADIAAELQHVADVLAGRYGFGPIDTTGPDLERHAGVYPVREPASVPMVRPGLVLVGDAVGTGSNLLGEGIRYAIASGRLAGAVIGEMFAERRPERHLQRYPRQWERRYGRSLRLAHRLNRRISAFSPQRWDSALELAAHWSPETMGRALATDLSAGLAWRVLRETPPARIRGILRALRA